jgi:hypothetical protein
MPNPGSNYTAVQGDSIESIAFETGFFWETIWNAPENAALRKCRKSAHVILPGDVVFIPGLRPRIEQRAADHSHRFVLRGVPSLLRLRFLVDDKARANAPYDFDIDGEARSGTTDGDGWLAEPTSPIANRAVVRFKRPERPESKEEKDPPTTDAEDEGTIMPIDVSDAPTHDVFRFDLRHMDPSNEVSGAKGRLHLLGYSLGPIDGNVTPQFEATLKSFQIANGLTETGELDDSTQATLSKFTGG